MPQTSAWRAGCDPPELWELAPMIRFNTLSATSIVPLLARLILFAAFFTAGWDKLMQVQEFRGQQADILMNLSVADVVRAAPAAVHVQGGEGQSLDEPDPNENSADERRSKESAEPLEGLQDPLPELPPDVVQEDSTSGERALVAKRLHNVTLLLVQQEWKGAWALRAAWALAIVELVGGALLLVGLFSRVWAAGLSIAMVGAFCITSIPILIESGGPLAVASDINAFNHMYLQLALLALAVGVLLTGPGPASIDRMIFRPQVNPEDEFI